MTSITIAWDGNAYSFLGGGIHTPLYEKRSSFGYCGCQLSGSTFDTLVSDVIANATFMRINVCGGEFFTENASQTRNYQQGLQANYLTRMNLDVNGASNRNNTPLIYIVTPVGAPSPCVASGCQTTITPNGLLYPANVTNTNILQAFVDTTASWQLYTNAIIAQIQNLIDSGCSVQYITTPNEPLSTTPGNHWQTGITAPQLLEFVQHCYLGQGMANGIGISQRFPWIKLIAGDQGYAYLSNILANPTALAACTGFGEHDYIDGAANSITGGTANCGVGTPQQGEFWVTECGGHFVGSSPTTDNCFQLTHNLHDLTTYCYAKALLIWTSLRDISSVYTSYVLCNDQTYSANGIANLNTSAGTFTLNGYYYASIAHLTAWGIGGAQILCPSTALLPDSSSTWNPISNVYIHACIRGRDSKKCLVFANRSTSSQTVIVNMTVGGSGYNTTGNRTDSSVSGLTWAANGTVASSGGALTLTVPATTISLFELT